jgi:hypothetical protein
MSSQSTNMEQYKYRVLELIHGSLTHNCIRFVVWKFGEELQLQLQLLQLVFRFLALNFCLVFGYLVLVHYPWLDIDFVPKLFSLSRLRCSGVAFVPMVG